MNNSKDMYFSYLLSMLRKSSPIRDPHTGMITSLRDLLKQHAQPPQEQVTFSSEINPIVPALIRRHILQVHAQAHQDGTPPSLHKNFLVYTPEYAKQKFDSRFGPDWLDSAKIAEFHETADEIVKYYMSRESMRNLSDFQGPGTSPKLVKMISDIHDTKSDFQVEQQVMGMLAALPDNYDVDVEFDALIQGSTSLFREESSYQAAYQHMDNVRMASGIHLKPKNLSLQYVKTTQERISQRSAQYSYGYSFNQRQRTNFIEVYWFRDQQDHLYRLDSTYVTATLFMKLVRALGIDDVHEVRATTIPVRCYFPHDNFVYGKIQEIIDYEF